MTVMVIGGLCWMALTLWLLAVGAKVVWLSTTPVGEVDSLLDYAAAMQGVGALDAAERSYRNAAHENLLLCLRWWAFA